MLKIKNNFIATVLVLVFVIFIATAGCSFLFFKAYSERKSIIELKKTILQNNKKGEENKILADMFNHLNKEKEIVSSVFIKEEDFVRLIKNLESTGIVAGVALKINSILPANINKKTNPQISLTAKGSFEQIFRYMNMLENLPYLVIIDNVSLQNIQDAKDKLEDFKKPPTNREWQALFNLRLESYEKN